MNEEWMPAVLGLELIAEQNSYHRKSKHFLVESRHFLDDYQFDPPNKNLDSPEPELEVYVDKRLYQGKVSWSVNSDGNIDYVLLPVTLEARGGNKNGGGGGGGGGDTSYFPDPYTTGQGNYSYLNFTSNFNIQLEFAGSGWTPDLYHSATSIAELFSYIIIGDETDAVIQESSGRGKNRTTNTYEIDDIHVTLTIDNIDGVGGTLGFAGPEYARVVDNNYDTILKGGLTLDSEDLASRDLSSIERIIFHEIAHIHGFGTMFSYKDLVTGNEYNTDTAAYAAYKAAYPNTTTPLLLEDGGGPGTAGGHWEETTGQIPANEIMTGYLNDGLNFLSITTVAAFQELGYETILDGLLEQYPSGIFLGDVTANWGEALA